MKSLVKNLGDMSPKRVAMALGVSEASLKRWCDRKVIGHVRTVGGHRRIPLSAVLRFVRKTGHALSRPGVLGLPATLELSERSRSSSREAIRTILESGDAEAFRSSMFGLYLSGRGVAEICDDVIAPIFQEMGECWERHDLEVYQERHACEIVARWLAEMSALLATTSEQAPYAIGGTLEHDPYALPTLMTEVVLREFGWRAESFGVCHPIDTLCAAVRDRKPALLWVSLSTSTATEQWSERWPPLARAAQESSTALVVGGRAVTEAMRQTMQATACFERLSQLVDFVRSRFGGVKAP